MELSLERGSALITMSLKRQTMAMPVNFAFLVPHATMRGCTKLTFWASSDVMAASVVLAVSSTWLGGCQSPEGGRTKHAPAAIWASVVPLRLLSSSSDFSAA